MRSRFLSLLFLLLVFLPQTALAQTQGAVLAGRVVDATGAALPGVTITAPNEATGVSQSTVTGSDGSYRTPTLMAGQLVTNPVFGTPAAYAGDPLQGVQLD